MSSCACVDGRQASAASCEALQLRLHQLEAARGREMQSHGELVNRLERQVESRSAHQSDLQTALAKLTTDKVRLEVEQQATRAKWLHECEQHDSAKTIIIRLREEMLQQQEQKRQELRALSESNDKLQTHEKELLVHHGVLQAQLDALRTDHQQVVAARESALQALNVQTSENFRLSDALKAKQLEAEALSVKVQLLSDELTRHQDTIKQAQAQIKNLERNCDRALQTRNRTLTWRKRQLDTCASRSFHQTLLVAWRSYALHKQKRANQELNKRLIAKVNTLSTVQAQLNAKIVTAKAFLSQLRFEMAEVPRQMALFRDDVCQVKLPQLLEQIRMNREQCAMVIADSEAKQLLALEAALARLETRKAIMKMRQQATLALLHKTRKRETGRQAFHGWKDMYLRNVVAQTTHAAMLAQQQMQSLICAAQISQSPQHKANKHQQQQLSTQQQAQFSQVPPPRLYFTSLAQQQQRKQLLKNRAKQETDESDRGPECSFDTQILSLCTTATANAAAAAVDADWKRWRRVNSVAPHQRKEDACRAALAASLPLSPTFRMRSSSLSTKQSRPRKSIKW